MPLTVCHLTTAVVGKAGSGRRTSTIVQAMRDAGYKTYNMSGATYEPSDSWDMRDIETIIVPSLHRPISLRHDIAAFWQLVKTFRAVKPDIVHTHLAKAGILGRLAAKVCGVPLIMHTVHGPTFPEQAGKLQAFIYQTLEKIAARCTDHFVFVGEELRQEYLRAGVLSKEKSDIIWTGRPKDQISSIEKMPKEELQACRREWGAADDDFVLAYVGRLVPGKDQMRAIDSLKALHERGIKGALWLIGEAHTPDELYYRDRLEERIAEFGLQDHVRLTGFRSDALKMMAAANVVLMTSLYEGLPNVAVEAGIAGRPFVAFRVSGLGEVIEEGVTGFVVEQSDMTGLIDRLEIIAKDPALAESMGRAALEQVKNYFSAEVMVTSKLALYERLAKSNVVLAKKRLEEAPSMA